ncbi:response regulator transcription factor [Pedobacter flavus]|uniref:Response regulator transcription factor n=1 Tax=Pedobacter flavus TaxID=3113906 RepID=A0ABU7H3F0_9SPHI|nr:response regulator transcription factor [Pedobacter sp. VNH31]MEE1885771.1 response regulator transcription factor [Pedobacter sp. VNH31]
MADLIKAKILFVEDELSLAEIVKETLELKGFEVIHATNCVSAQILQKKNPANIFVLDVMLPDGDGFSLLKKLRQHYQTPAIFLTSKSLPSDVVSGFESGANDYLKKPFSIEELIVRIKFLIGQIQTTNNEITKYSRVIGDYLFHYPVGILEYKGNNRKLTNRESELLHKLTTHSGNLLKREDLLMEYWGNDDYFSGRSLDVFVTKLRKYLKDDPSIAILNFRGQGYKMIL